MNSYTKTIGTIVFAIPLFTYIYTLFPTVATQYSGDLITSSYNLELAHSPGFPLYMIIGKFFSSIIPFGNIAWRYNVLSAILSAGSILLLYLNISTLLRTNTFSKKETPTLKTNTIAGAVALFFAFTTTFWSQSVIASIHPLNILLLLTTTYLTIKWYHSTKKENFIYAALLTLSLAATILPQNIFFLAPLFLLIALKKKELLKNLKFWGTSLIVIAAGLSPYLYLFISDPQLTLNTFFEHITTLQYQAARLEYAPITSDAPQSLIQSFTQTPKNTLLHLFIETFFFPILVLIPLIKLILEKKSPKTIPATLAIITTFLISIFFYNFNLVSQDLPGNTPFYLPTFVFTIIISSLGLYLLFQKTPSKLKTPLLIFISILFAAPLALNFSTNNQKNNYLAYDIAKASLHYLPQNAKLFVDDNEDFLFPIIYLQKIEQFRPDIQIITNYTTKLKGYPQWSRFDIQTLNDPDAQIFTQKHNESPTSFFYAHTTPFALEMIPQYKYKPQIILDEVKQIPIFDNTTIRGLNHPNPDQSHKRLMAHYYFTKGRLSINYNTAESEKHFQKAIEIGHKNEAPTYYYYYYIAHMYNHNFQYPSAIYYIQRAIETKPQEYLTEYLKSLITKSNESNQ